MSVSHGVHRVMHDSPIVPFAIFLYGYARADSYGYPGGLRLADLTLECVPGHPGDGLDNDCDRRIDEEIKNFIDDDNDGNICLFYFRKRLERFLLNIAIMRKLNYKHLLSCKMLGNHERRASTSGS